MGSMGLLYQIQQNMETKGRFTLSNSGLTQSFGKTGFNRGKILSTTRGSLESMRNPVTLPQLNRSLSKNTTGKIASLLQEADELQKKVHELRRQTKQSRRIVTYLKGDLVDRHLGSHSSELNLKTSYLDKYCKLTRNEHEQRSELLNRECSQLNQSSTVIKQLLHMLVERMDHIEHNLGIYSGKQKHKV